MPDAALLEVEVVAAHAIVWSGQARSVIARTTEGDIGILPGHEPLLATLVPSAAEVLSADGNREIIAVDGGFISVAQGHVSILSQFAQLAHEITLHEAEGELAEATRHLDEGDVDEATMRHFRRASAQVKAAQRIR